MYIQRRHCGGLVITTTIDWWLCGEKMEIRKKEIITTADCRDIEFSMRASVLLDLTRVGRPLEPLHYTIRALSRRPSPSAFCHPSIHQRRYLRNLTLTPSQAGLRFVRKPIWPEAETEEVEAVRREIWEGQSGGVFAL